MRITPILLMLVATSLVQRAEAQEFDFAKHRDRHSWIWKTPKRPAPPAVKRTQWPIDPIDAFILAKLESKSLSPARPAADRVWLTARYSHGLWHRFRGQVTRNIS